jgi:dinuclear metal center YbgI/SA1388 family protein
MVSLDSLIQSFEKLWPKASAEAWDRPGLIVGDLHQEVTKVHLSVDATYAVIEEALSQGANLLITHHPLLLRGVSELGSQSVKGNIVSAAIKGNLSIFAAHTNADIAEVGTAVSLARLFGLQDPEVLDPASGHGLVGNLSKPETLLGFATRIAKLLPSVASGIKVAGDPAAVISRVGLAPGAGDGLLDAVMQLRPDVFVTSDLRHHPSQDFLESNAYSSKVALIDISHWAAESIWLGTARKELSLMHPDVSFILSELSTDPWDFAVMQ